MGKYKLLIIIILLVILLGFCGCSYVPVNTLGNETENSDDRMTLMHNDGYCIIYRDNETGVQYIRIGQGVCVMVNADGSPYVGEG